MNTFENIDHEFCDDKYQKLYREQQSIGWRQIFYDRLTHTWVDIQNEYVADNESRGIQTIASTIRFIFDILLK